MRELLISMYVLAIKIQIHENDSESQKDKCKVYSYCYHMIIMQKVIFVEEISVVKLYFFEYIFPKKTFTSIRTIFKKHFTNKEITIYVGFFVIIT